MTQPLRERLWNWGGIRAGHHLRRGDHRAGRDRRPDRKGYGEAVIFFNILAAALAIASIVYLVYALLKPEKF